MLGKQVVHCLAPHFSGHDRPSFGFAWFGDVAKVRGTRAELANVVAGAVCLQYRLLWAIVASCFVVVQLSTCNLGGL